MNSQTDPFSINAQKTPSGKVQIGLDEQDPTFKLTKWCYDTPGVVHSDQILNLLTTEELLLTLPKEIIRPRSFTLRVGQTLLIAGLGRLDYLDATDTGFIRQVLNQLREDGVCYVRQPQVFGVLFCRASDNHLQN